MELIPITDINRPFWVKDKKLVTDKKAVGEPISPVAKILNDLSMDIATTSQYVDNFSKELDSKYIDKAIGYFDKYVKQPQPIEDIRIQSSTSPSISITLDILTHTSADFLNEVEPVKKVLKGDLIDVTYIENSIEKTIKGVVNEVISSTQLKIDHSFPATIQSIRYIIKRKTFNVLDFTSEAIQKVNEFAGDLSNTGGKFIINKPFFGGLERARYIAVNNLTRSSNNFPNFSDEAYTSSINLVVNVGSDVVQLIKFLALIAPLFSGVFKDIETPGMIKTMIESPFFSPFIDLFTPEMLEQQKKEVATSFSSLADPLLDLWNTGSKISTTTASVATDMKNIWDSTLAGKIPTIDGINTTDTPNPIGELLASANLLKREGIDPVVNPEDPWAFFDNRTIFDRDVQADFRSDFEKFPSNPYDHWFNLLTLGDLFPGIGDVANFATNLLNQANSGAKFAADGIQNGLEFAKQVKNLAFGSATELMNNANALIPKLKEEMDLFDFNMFITPPMTGGTEQLRYVHEQWMKSGALNAPNYDPNSITVLVQVVFGGPKEAVQIGANTIASLTGIQIDYP